MSKVWKLPYGSHRDLVPLIAECVPLDVALVFRFIKSYITIALSGNMAVNCIANTITFAYRSTMGQNVRYIMSKYNMTHRELLYMPISAIKHKCLHTGHGNLDVNYKMGDTVLGTTVKEKDLGVTISADKKVSEQCGIVALKCNNIFEFITET